MKSVSTGSRAASQRQRSIETDIDSTSGFTLFETLVALLVLSIGLVSLFEAHSHALKSAGIAADYARARILAQGLLAEAVAGWSQKVAAKTGDTDGFQWFVDVEPETAPWAAVQTRDNWKLQRIRVTVRWQGNRYLELNSLKLGRANG